MTTTVVTSVRELGRDTARVGCDDATEFDLCTRDFGLRVGDRVRVSCGVDPPVDADYVASGLAFARSDRFSFVSCGGHLAKVHGALAPNVRVFLGVGRAASRGRASKRSRE